MAMDGNCLELVYQRDPKGKTNQVHQFWGAENLELKSYGR